MKDKGQKLYYGTIREAVNSTSKELAELTTDLANAAVDIDKLSPEDIVTNKYGEVYEDALFIASYNLTRINALLKQHKGVVAIWRKET